MSSIQRKHLWLIMCAVLLLISSPVTAQQTQEPYRAPGLDIIGRGYDVFGKYADQTSLKPFPLFNFNKPYVTTRIGSNDYEVPELVFLENISAHHIKEVEGFSIREYAQSLATKAGLKVESFFFKASINTSFAKKVSGSEEFFYHTYMDVIPKWRITLDARDVKRLIDVLDPNFARELQSVEPMIIFQRYGTHFVASAYLGGRAEYSSRSEITEKNQSVKIKAALKAKYGAIKANAELATSHMETLKNSNTKTTQSAVGGNAEYAKDILDSSEQYNRWVEGIKDTPVLCDFVGERSLIPIWNLCNDSNRKDFLQEKYLELCQIYPLPVPPTVYRLLGMESMPSGMNKNKVNHDFELTFDVKPMQDSKNDIVGAFESNIALWKIYFPSDGDIIRFISRNRSMENTTMINAKFSKFGKIGDWNNISLKRKNNIVLLSINGKIAGHKKLIGKIPVLSSEVKFGYLGNYLTDIYVKNIQIK